MADADRRTRIVFITRDLSREMIEASLAAFEAADEPTAPPTPLPAGGRLTLVWVVLKFA